MKQYSIGQIAKLPHLSEILSDKNGHFTPEKAITDIGLYDAAIIDTRNVRFDNNGKGPTHIEASPDVKAFQRFVMLESNIKLPCAYCESNEAHATVKAFNLSQNRFIDYSHKIPAPGKETKTHNIFDLEYDLISGEFVYFKQESFQDEDETNGFKNKCAEVCKKAILDNAASFSKKFFCCINAEHEMFAVFLVMDLATYVDDELQKKKERAKEENSQENRKTLIEVTKIIEENKYSLLIEKVGQYPSMADIQMFDVERYRSILKKQFRDFSMAIGLYSAHVGCGSFVYLRRIFENLVEDEHAKVSKEQKWNEDQEKEYLEKHFNEKIAYLENQGRSIIPNDIPELKSKLYGILSKGIHYSSDDLCIELFPYMKYSIEILLDHKLVKEEQERKKMELRTKLAAQTAEQNQNI